MRDGRTAARSWMWRQARRSTPALAHWLWWRGWTGYEPRSSAFRPRGPMMKDWITDTRYAARRLRARPVYTLVAVLTLALGVGGMAAAFGIARPLILGALPYKEAQNLAVFWMPRWWTEEEFVSMRDKFGGFSKVGAYRGGDLTLREGNAPARLIPGTRVSDDLFDVLGVRPMIGRSFQRGDDAQGSAPEVILSYGLWQELGGRASLVGSRLTLDGEPRTVIGVMPKGFWFPSPDIRLWHVQPLNPTGRNGSWVLVGRLAPGMSMSQMQGPLAQITKALGERFRYSGPDDDKTRNPTLTPIRDELLGKMRPAVVATIAAMGLILLIACANVAALMLGQTEGRATELAVRTALGATRGRITLQLVTEALVLGVAGGLVGAGFAAIGFRYLTHALPLEAWSDSLRFDWTIFIAALAFAVLAMLLVVLAPTASLWRGNLRQAVSGLRTGGVHGRGARIEHGLIVGEVALAMVVATGAGLLVRSVANRYAIDPGIRPAGVAVIDLALDSKIDARQRRLKLEDVFRALDALPGVKSSAAAMKLPLRGGGDSFNMRLDGWPDDKTVITMFRIATRDYWSTMGYRLRAGRLFDPSDRLDSTEVHVVINEALARKYFRGQDPLGKRLFGAFGVPERIIGVLADASEADLKPDVEPVRYYLVGELPFFGSQGSIVVRTTRAEDAERMLDVMRRTVQRVAPSFAVQQTTTMSRVFVQAIGPVRQLTSLLAFLSGLAVTLGAVGIYGVISHFVARRKRDWAIRVALGLPKSGVIRSVVGQGLGLGLIGIAVGALAAVAATRLLTSFLYGVGAFDPLAFTAASAVILVIAGVAAFVPARRAGSADPVLILREQ
jgi:predicted permease